MQIIANPRRPAMQATALAGSPPPVGIATPQPEKAQPSPKHRPLSRPPSMAQRTANTLQSAVGQTTLTANNLLEGLKQYAPWRTRVTPQDWINAIRSYEEPMYRDRLPLLDIYDQVVLDAHVSACRETLVNTVCGQRMYFVNRDGSINTEASRYTQASWFTDLVAHIVDSQLVGHTLVQLLRQPSGAIRCELIPQRHVQPWRGEVLRDQHDWTGLPYRDRMRQNGLIEIGPPDNMGWYSQATYNWIQKKETLLQWLNFTSRTGVPIPVLNTQGTMSPETLEELNEQLDALTTSDNPSIITQGVQSISWMEPASTDMFQVFKEQVHFHNQEISKLLLGGTMLMENGSSFKQAEIHLQQSQVARVQSSKLLVMQVINEQLVPMLRRLGDVRLVFAKNEELSNSDLLAAIQEMRNQGLTLDADQWRELYGLRAEPQPPQPNAPAEPPQL